MTKARLPFLNFRDISAAVANVIAGFRDDRTTTTTEGNPVVSVKKQNSDVDALILGNDGNGAALIGGNAVGVRLGNWASGVFTEYLNWTTAGTATWTAASASPLTISRPSSATNVGIGYSTSGGTVFAGTGSGVDFAISSSSNLSLATAWFKINSTTATFQTDIALGTNKAISFAGTGAATTRTNLGVLQALTGTATYDPPSLADGAGASTTVTVTGAALGDVALASFSLSTQGITVTANVTAADTVTVRFQNETGGVLDLASGTLKAVVLK